MGCMTGAVIAEYFYRWEAYPGGPIHERASSLWTIYLERLFWEDGFRVDVIVFCLRRGCPPLKLSLGSLLGC